MFSRLRPSHSSAAGSPSGTHTHKWLSYAQAHPDGSHTHMHTEMALIRTCTLMPVFDELVFCREMSGVHS